MVQFKTNRGNKLANPGPFAESTACINKDAHTWSVHWSVRAHSRFIFEGTRDTRSVETEGNR